MKRSLAIALLGLILAGVTYGVVVGSRAHSIRELEHRCGPELAWLKTEFELDEPTFERVSLLHEAYLPVCEGYCRQIDEQYRELADLLTTSETVTPEISRVLERANELRARCQAEMLKHFFQVSRAMPPEQGRRYLEWMRRATITPTHESMVPQGSAPINHGGHHD